MRDQNFAWGEPFAVREALSDLGCFSQISTFSENEHQYLPHEYSYGPLERILVKYLFKITGKKYYAMITPGGLSGLQIATAVLKKPVNYDLLHFGFYKTALNGSPSENPEVGKTYVTASPSNPEGLIRVLNEPINGHIVWDMAYGTNVYSKTPYIFPKHTFAVGSFGKTIGLPGFRLGWIASERFSLIEKCWDHMIHNTIGYSTLAYQKTKEIAVDENFLLSATTLAGSYIDDNREEMQKLEYLSEERTVPENGMFWWTKPSNSLIGYLQENQVSYVKGSSCGGDDSYIRISLGQKRKATKEMVALILKSDGK